MRSLARQLAKAAADPCQDERQGLAAARGCRTHILLKDVEMVEGDLSRLQHWVELARQAAESFA